MAVDAGAREDEELKTSVKRLLARIPARLFSMVYQADRLSAGGREI